MGIVYIDKLRGLVSTTPKARSLRGDIPFDTRNVLFVCGGAAPERRTWTNGHRVLLYRFRRGSSAIIPE